MTHVWQKYDYDMENWGILLISIFFKNGKFRQNAKVWQKYDKSMTIGRKIRQKYDILKKYDNSMTKVWQKYDYDKSMTQWQPCSILTY